MHLPPKTREKNRVELGIFGAVILAFVVCGCILTSRSTQCDKETFKG